MPIALPSVGSTATEVLELEVNAASREGWRSPDRGLAVSLS